MTFLLCVMYILLFALVTIINYLLTLVNWKQVINKYLAMNGRSDADLSMPMEKFDDSNVQPDMNDMKSAEEKTDIPV